MILKNMITKATVSTQIIASGREKYEKTSEFSAKKARIIEAVKLEYLPDIKSERRMLKKLVLMIKMQLQITKRLKQLSSDKNLHSFNPCEL